MRLPHPDHISRNLRLVREGARRTRREVAAAAGISQSFIEKLELGYTRPSAKTLRTLARVLGVTVRYLGQELALPPHRERPQDALAKVVRLGREAAGLTPQELADAAGISLPYVWNIEGGRRVPRRSKLKALASALGVPERALVAAASKWQPFPLAEVVLGLRRTARLSRSSVAVTAGISPRHLAAIEQGKALPSVETIDGLARALRVDRAVLLERLDAPLKHRARINDEPELK